MIHKIFSVVTIATVLFAQNMLAQDAQAVVPATPASTYYALRYTLLATAILLMIIVIALTYVLNNLATIYLQDWKRDTKNTTKSIVGIGAMLSLMSQVAQAQDATAVTPSLTFGIDLANMPVDIYALMFAVLVEMIMVYGLVKSIFRLLRQAEEEIQATDEPLVPEKTFFQTINQTVAIEDEHTLDLQHDYDGIRELDNKVPSWWMMSFYASILFGVIYMIRMYGTQTLPTQLEELAEANKVAAIQKEAYLKLAANNVDENSVKISDATGIAAGKDLFKTNCVACHGSGGEGTVGPNLTDDYWLHQGGLKDIFYTIKYGWSEKGMKSWKEDFSPSQMADIASYVSTLRGTNPLNPKEKQGELWIESLAALSDSSAVVADSTSSAK
jgi:cytochrome c oxidase cbb3-type subunit III